MSRTGIPALVLGFCAFAGLTQQAALGQAQLGTAESCFDQGPEKLPSGPITAIPTPPAPLPVRFTRIAVPKGIQPVRISPQRPAQVQRENPLARNRFAPLLKSPDGTLTAAR
ncbi:MAG: hypothetical protein WBX18_07255 [Terracidiphilus sp.]